MGTGARRRESWIAGLGVALLVLVPWFLSAPGAGPKKRESSPAAETSTVRGVVLDSDGRPVVGARVFLHPDEFRCESGVDGAFRFPAPAGVRLLVFALPDAAAPAALGQRVRAEAGGPAVVVSVPSGAALHFRLSAPSPLRGPVTAVLSHRGGIVVRRGNFDPEGHLDVAGLPRTETFALFAQDPHAGLCAVIEDIVPNGQEIVVPLVPSLTIRGEVALPEGAVLTSVMTVFEAVFVTAEIDPAGSFTMRGLPPGAYRLQASALLDGEQLTNDRRVKAGAEDVLIPIRRR